MQLLICVVEKINKELSRLEDEESQAEAALAEAFARISRLRKMQKQLRKKGVEMLKKGLDDMEALEEEERREAEEKNRREDLERAQAREAELAFQIQSACATEAVDFSGFSFNPSMEDLFGDIAQGGVTDPSSSGGTGESNVGTSSGA
jgi:multidrug efflux pump subunit AcrA (membrane-fusion protein)